ncbi:MAG: NAD(P)/FAD-dependent oxidoreductase [Verrucomicrobiota bacterium]
MREPTKQPHIVVLGAGFGGLEFCRQFKRKDVSVTLIDRQNHHLFQPLLYQVATAGLSVPEIAKPIRSIFRDRKNLRVLLDEATSLDLDSKRIELRDTGEISYDYLVIAVGARTNYFGNDQWEAVAPGLKTLDDATRIRHDLLLAFEEAERELDPARRQALMRTVVIGGGPTGVELAGAIAELSKRVLAKDFRNIETERAEIVLLEVAPRILLPFSEKLSDSAKKQLEDLGVDVRLKQNIRHIREGAVELEDGTIEAGNILWGAGVRASPVCDHLGVEQDKAGRLKVRPDCSLPGHPEVFALGDIVHLTDAKGQAVPGISPAAIQMGKYVSRVISHQLDGGRDSPPFAYFDKGNMATLGRSKAVARIGKLEFSGFTAWMAWLGVHLIFLIGFRNKLTVLIQWFYSYVTYRRGARIITGLDRIFKIGNPEARPASRAEKRSHTAPEASTKP